MTTKEAVEVAIVTTNGKRGAQWRVIRDILQLALAWAERLDE